MTDVSHHTHFSSYREMLLEHLFAGAVMRHLWLRGVTRLELLKPQVDDSGYDLVLEANGVVRHVQLKASHHGARTARVNIHLALAEKPSGCVVWIRFDPTTLELGPFLWLGGAPGEKLTLDSGLKVTRQTKPNTAGVKTERTKLRVVPRAAFDEITTIEALVVRMFGVFPSTGKAATEAAEQGN